MELIFPSLLTTFLPKLPEGKMNLSLEKKKFLSVAKAKNLVVTITLFPLFSHLLTSASHDIYPSKNI